MKLVLTDDEIRFMKDCEKYGCHDDICFYGDCDCDKCLMNVLCHGDTFGCKYYLKELLGRIENNTITVTEEDIKNGRTEF